MSDIIVTVKGRRARISDQPGARNLYSGTWLDDGAPTLFIHSGGFWIEHPYDANCADCRAWTALSGGRSWPT